MNTGLYRGLLRPVLINILLLISYTAYSQTDELVIELYDNMDYGSLQFDNPKGSVKVTGYNGNTVIVTGTARNKGTMNDNTDSYKRISQPGFSLTAELKDNNIILFTESFDNAVDFDIQVPSSMSLRISCHDDGEILIYRVNGEIDLKTEYGDILAGNISGSSVINSAYGNIKIAFSKLDPDNTCMYTTFDGNIELIFPGEAKASLKMRSPGGEILSKLNLQTHKQDTKLQLERNTAKYLLDSWITAELNGGGTEIIISSHSGKIILNDRKDVTFQY